MSRRVLITGASSGIGAGAARELLEQGHRVLAHSRSAGRMLPEGAEPIHGDLADTDRLSSIADQVQAAGGADVIIHNAGVLRGPDLAAVNVIAPYVLAALIPAQLHIVISSSMHRGGVAEPSGRLDRISYSDSKLLVTILAAALPRRSGMLAAAVDPGWVPTKMGGAGASDDLVLGHRTQARLAAGTLTTPPEFSYWFHEEQQRPHPAVLDATVQEALLDALASRTGVAAPAGRA